jgi:cytochrome c oxidase subunit I+III
MKAETSSYFQVDEERARAFDRAWARPASPFRVVNNVPLAKRYLLASFIFFLIGGLMALLIRIQLAIPENDFIDAETYNQLFTMHGTTMMFLFAIPFIEALATFILPLLLGSRDLPFPRLTSFAFWTFVWGGILLYSSFLFGLAPAAGWFAYVPLSNRDFMPGMGMDFWVFGLTVAELAAIAAAVEIIVSILRMRAPGMSLHRLPIFAWAMLVTAFMIIFAFTPLVVGTTMLELDRKGITSFFVPEAGGEPLLWQHLFWVFGHPEVYIMFLPATGIVSHVVATFARRPLVSYTLVVLAIIATGFLSFGLWVHHMFTTGLSPVAMGFFAAASLMIAIPSGVQVFSWIATLWLGRPTWRTPLLFVIGFLVIFTIGGLTGVMLGSVPFDYQVHDSHFVVAHFHYVLIGGVVFPLYAGLYYWLPKITGRLLSERLGRWNFWIMFVSFNVAFFPMHIPGLLGMPRRVYTFEPGLGWEVYNFISTVGALAFGLGAALLAVNFLWSLRRGAPAGPNPWGGDSLEWWESSPSANGQFRFPPFVRSRHPLWEQDSFAPPDAAAAAMIEPLRSGPGEWRGALLVSVLDGRPLGIVHIAGPTRAPFIVSVGFILIAIAALFENAWLLLPGAALLVGGLWGWFRPDPSVARAIEEIGTDAGPEKLPLAVAGPLSNGWWGMLVFNVILFTALAALVAVYYYLGEGPSSWPPLQPELGLASWATLAMAGAAGGMVLAARAARRQRLPALRLGLVATIALAGLFLWLSSAAFAETGLVPRESAYASGFFALMAFQWLVTALHIVAAGSALAWAVGRPADVRGRAVALNAELLGYFVAGSWAVVFAVLFITPRLW